MAWAPFKLCLSLPSLHNLVQSLWLPPAHLISWHSSGTSSSTSSHTNTQPLSGVTSLAGGGGLTPLAVLKAHVSTVTDLAWARDGAHLVSVGAGGAVYWWEVGSGTRLMELEYVDKACVYTAGGCLCGWEGWGWGPLSPRQGRGSQ